MPGGYTDSNFESAQNYTEGLQVGSIDANEVIGLWTEISVEDSSIDHKEGLKDIFTFKLNIEGEGV